MNQLKKGPTAPRLLLVALLLSVTNPAAWAQGPTGSEFPVNSYTTSYQSLPKVASDANGNFVVIWGSIQDGSGFGIYGQRFNASLVPQGSEFRANTFITGSQVYPAVASAVNGNFVVAWQSTDQDGGGYGVFAQLFNASGAAQGSEFRANSFTTGNQRRPTVASDAAGNFVVAWESFGQDGAGYGVFGQLFNALGVPQGSEFRVNSYTTNNQSYASVASDANRNFVVVWHSSLQDGSLNGVFGQLFNASGVPRGSEFRVNSFTTSNQYHPSAAADADGDFVVVWTSAGQATTSVFGQLFNASGAPQGSEFRVNSYTPGLQYDPSAASDPNGNFVVAWSSYIQDGSSFGVFGQRFNAGGVPAGAEFQINSYTTGRQSRAALAADANGGFVVAWNSYGQDGSGPGIFGRGYSDIIFEDGFE